MSSFIKRTFSLNVFTDTTGLQIIYKCNIPVCFLFSTADITAKTKKYYETDSVLLPIRKATCRYCGGYIGSDSNPYSNFSYSTL
jgi:hypothetical protein